MSSSPDAPARERRGGERERRGGPLGALREVGIVVVAALVLSFLVKSFLFQAFYIPSPSMEDTLLVGDRVVVSELTPGPFALHRGDVVVFADPGGWLPPATTPQRGPVGRVLARALTFVGIIPQDSSQHLIKRVIGLPGDRVACCDAHGRTTVNGHAVDERSYLKPGSRPSELTFSTTVPAGSIWVEGDNRQDSGDSRYHQGLAGGGSVPEDLVVGRAVLRVWPLGRVGWLSDHRSAFAGVPAASSG